MILLGRAVVDRVPDIVRRRSLRTFANSIIRRISQPRDHADELAVLKPMRLEPREALLVISQMHPQLRIGPELENRRLHALRFQIIARYRVATEEKRRAIDDKAQIGREVSW